MLSKQPTIRLIITSGVCVSKLVYLAEGGSEPTALLHLVLLLGHPKEGLYNSAEQKKTLSVCLMMMMSV